MQIHYITAFNELHFDLHRSCQWNTATALMEDAILKFTLMHVRMPSRSTHFYLVHTRKGQLTIDHYYVIGKIIVFFLEAEKSSQLCMQLWCMLWPFLLSSYFSMWLCSQVQSVFRIPVNCSSSDHVLCHIESLKAQTSCPAIACVLPLYFSVAAEARLCTYNVTPKRSFYLS